MKHASIVALILCAGSALCVSSARAQTDLYIAEYKFNDAQVSAVRTDGTNPRTLFSLPSSFWLPIGLDYNPATARLTWMDSAGSSKILRANLDGTGLSTVANVTGFARGASRDALGRIYYSTDNRIERINSDGSGKVVLFTSSVAGHPVGDATVDATNGHVYFGEYGQVRRMNLDGASVKTLFSGGSTVRAIDLDIASRHLYWLDSNTNSDLIARINLDGSDFTIVQDASPLIGQSSGYIMLIVDAANDRLFFADDLLDLVYRSDLDGSNTSVIFTSVSDRSPSGLALSTGVPVQALNDCNGNGIADDVDIANGEPDCDDNGVPDSCQSDPCAAPVYLIDQGSNAAASGGRALGVPGSAWEAFQPFDVPAGGWSIGRIEIDGFTVVIGNGLGILVSIHSDNGTGTRPDESVTLASADGLNYLFNTNLENWVGADLQVTLPEGRYWVHLEANEPSIYWGSINHGFGGLSAISKGASGTFTSPGSPIAMRLIENEACLADYNGDAEVDILDFLDFFEDFGGCENQPAPCGTLFNADVNGDTIVDILDFLEFLDAFGQGC